MKVDKGYKCNKCGKIYHNDKYSLPIYCNKCGEDLIEKRYGYNLRYDGEEILETNVWGGYDYVRSVTTEHAIPIKIKRSWFKWVEL